MAECIRVEMVRQAEESGGRAFLWNLSTFNRVGGDNTLRNVWATLKGDGRVGGIKREREEDDTDCEAALKKTKVSSNVSSTCELLSNIVLGHDTSTNCLEASMADEDEVFMRNYLECSSEDRVSNVSMLERTPSKPSGMPKQDSVKTSGKTSAKPKQGSDEPHRSARKTSAKPKQNDHDDGCG